MKPYIAILSFALLASGCSGGPESKEDGPRGKPIIPVFTESELYIGVPPEKLTIADSDVVFPPDPGSDAEKVAMWVTERMHIISWCLSENQLTTEINEWGGTERRYKKMFPGENRRETRLDQAIAIAQKVVEKVPDATKVRLLLARSLFHKGANETWIIDTAINMAQDRRDKLPTASPEEKAKLEDEIKQLEGVVKDHGPAHTAYLTQSLKSFIAYMNAVPMDKIPLDWIWKIHFQLGNFKEALAALNQLLETDLITDPDLRRKYLEDRKKIQDYRAELELNPNAPKPFSPGAMQREPG